MSSDSESFTSHSCSIEKQLDIALENEDAEAAAGVDGELDQTRRQDSASPANGHSQDADDSPDLSLSEELPPPAEHEAVRPASVFDEPITADEPGRASLPQLGENSGATPHRRPASLSNGQQQQAPTTDWSINSPYVESARPEAGGRELELRSLSRQLCKKSARRGFDFKLMLVGESGIGKTTLIDSLFNVESTRNLGSQYVRSQRDSATTTKLCERFFELEEGGISVRLTVIDTPGFATELDSSGCVQPVLNYVERQLDEYYRLEQGTDRSKLTDSRVHAMLYLINPSGRGLKQVDLMCLKALHNKVNIVPVIGKADSLTAAEKTGLKARVLQDLTRNGISVYSLPEFDDCFDQVGDDFYLKNQYESLRDAMPLAIVGSNLLVQRGDGQWSRAREYPWGVVDIENPEHSDFLKLRELLIMYMEDFKDKTHEVIYEQIRLNRLRQTDWHLSRMTQTLADRERMLREKDEELRRLRDAVEDLQKAGGAGSGGAKSSSLPMASQSSSSDHPTTAVGLRAYTAAAASTRSTVGGSSSSAYHGGPQQGRSRTRYSQYD